MPIRFAKHEDIPQMVDLLIELFSLEPDFPIHPANHAAGLQLLLGNSRSSILVASEDSAPELLGMVSLQPHISTGFGCKDAILEDLVVKRAFRGKGWGTLLLKSAEQEARNLGFQRLRLVTDSSNAPALDFYRKHGWSQGRMTSFYRTF